MLLLRIVCNNDSYRLAGVNQHIVQNLIETITHPLKQRGFNFRLMNQYLHQSTVNLLNVLFIEQFNTDITGDREVLME